MSRYEKEWQYMKNTKVIAEDLFIPKENLK
jgi:hypothetical protein